MQPRHRLSFRSCHPAKNAWPWAGRLGTLVGSGV